MGAVSARTGSSTLTSPTVEITPSTAPVASVGVAVPTVPEPVAAEPVATELGATEAGVTEPGVTEAGVTEPGVTEPGVTEAGVTEPSVTEPGPTAEVDVEGPGEENQPILTIAPASASARAATARAANGFRLRDREAPSAAGRETEATARVTGPGGSRFAGPGEVGYGAW
jgi:hypothetical protein